MQIDSFASPAPLVLAAALATTAVAPLGAQEPPPAAYRAPVIALVQPPPGGSVPSDKPVVVFRFTPGEPGDPIDVRSFAITVDGEDRTPHFQVTANDAWGALRDVDPGASASARDAAARTHSVAARICSARGTCAGVTASVRVETSPAVSAEPQSRRESLLDLLLRAARRLLIP